VSEDVQIGAASIVYRGLQSFLIIDSNVALEIKLKRQYFWLIFMHHCPPATQR